MKVVSIMIHMPINSNFQPIFFPLAKTVNLQTNNVHLKKESGFRNRL
jgi:hypothetical protein